MDINDLVRDAAFEKGHTQSSAHVLTQYAARQGAINASDIRKLSHGDPKLYYKALVEFLKRTYPDKPDIIEGVLTVKPHGLGFVMPQSIREEGLTCFPEDYLELGPLPTHTTLSLPLAYHLSDFPVKTFVSQAYAKTIAYLKNICTLSKGIAQHMDKQTQQVYEDLDVHSWIMKRLAREKWIQHIDNREIPLSEDIFTYTLSAPSVLFKAYTLPARVVIAITGIWSNVMEKDRGYINCDAVFAKALAKEKKVTILDLDEVFGGGTVDILLGETNITLIGVQTDPHTTPIINARKHAKSELNSIQYNLPLGLNGKTYLTYLEKAVKQIPKDTDVLLATIGTNLYVFDSMGLQLVEEVYFKRIGEVIHKHTTHIPKIILQPGGGFEDWTPHLFTEVCSAFGGKP